MVTQAMTVNAAPSTGVQRKEMAGKFAERNALLQGTGVEISIHVDAAQRPFYRIDSAVLIAVKLLEVVMRQIKCLRMRHAGGIGGRTGIIPLRVLENAIMHQVRPRLDEGFRYTLL